MLKKRSFTLAGHRTSIAIEPEFWAVLEEEALKTGSSLSAFVAAHRRPARTPTPARKRARLAALAAKTARG